MSDEAQTPTDQVIPDPNNLAAKAPVLDEKTSKDLMKKAQAVVKKMSSDYMVWVREDFVDLHKAIGEMTAERTPESMRKVYAIVHDMKGQGGSFGYGMLSDIGHNLCRYLERQTAVTDRVVEIVTLHVQSMELVIRKKITDDKTAMAMEVLEGLEKVIDNERKIAAAQAAG